MERGLRRPGHASPQEPFDAFSGSRYAVVEDPDENLVDLKSPLTWASVRECHLNGLRDYGFALFPRTPLACVPHDAEVAFLGRPP